MTTLTEAKPLAEQIEESLRAQFEEGAERPDWKRLEKAARLTRRQIDRVFQARFATTPTRYLADLRAGQAETLLSQGHDVLRAATQAGYSGPGRLHDALLKRRGMTPGEIRAEGEGVVIHVAAFDTPLGTVILAATERGLCAIRLCAAAQAREHLDELRRDFPRAKMRESPAILKPYADQLVAFLEKRSDRFDPRLDIHGTAFQREVWAALRKLKPGETTTYSALAKKLGRLESTRAVANACARNGLAIAIPCHRVLGKDGSLRGYRWGLEWKRRLLELESHMKKRKR